MKKVIYLCFLLALIFDTTGQTSNCTYSGKLIDKQTSVPVPFASIYISAISKGVMTNSDGEFRFEIPCGNYQAKIQSLGYETLLYPLTKEGAKELLIKLSPQANQMEEVVVSAKAEDPAYYIMRKAIILSEFYRSQIKKYACNIYLKEMNIVEKTPDILKLFATQEEVEEIKTGSVSEVYLNYSFEYPNIINEHIISKKTSYNDTSSNRGSSYLNFSFYNIGGSQLISPLSKSAFQVYKFHLEDSYEEEGITVKKIQIIPKREGQDLMKGYIYINDGYWSINRVDIQFKQNMIDVEYKQLYTPVNDLTWFPIGHDIKVNAALFGFEGYYKYVASISDVVTTNDSLSDAKIKSLIDQQLILNEEKFVAKSGEKLTKTQEKINELMAKEKLSKADAFKMIKLLEKEAKEEEKKNPEKESLEIPNTERKIEYADSAFNRNSNAWDTLRAVPLTEKELEVYAKTDSTLNKPSTSQDSTKLRKPKSTFSKILFGKNQIKHNGEITGWTIPGLFSSLMPYYNTVDGLLLQKKIFFFSKTSPSNKAINFSPELRYSFARNDVMGYIHSNYFYAPKQRGNITIDFGKINDDFNNNNPISPLLNSISTLAFTKNYKKLYQKNYIAINNTIDIANGLVFNTSFEYAQRKGLTNHSNFKLFNPFGIEYTSNAPFSSLDSAKYANHNSSKLSLGLSYTPKYFYRMNGNRKVMLNSKYPTFNLRLTQGIQGIGSSQTNFSLAELSITQSKKFGLIDNISYYVGGGKFISKPNLYFADYKHFNTIPFYVAPFTNANTFRLLDYYSYSSSDYFLEGDLTIEDNNILLKRIPFFGRRAWTESVRVSYLKNEILPDYYEFGYGINRLFLFLNIEISAAYYSNKIQSVGGKLIFSIPFAN